MAMLDTFPLGEKHIKEAFAAAARDGRRYLLLLEDMITDPMLVVQTETVHAADSEGEIVAHIRANNSLKRWDGRRLLAVYDTRQPLAAQQKGCYEDSLVQNLSSMTRKILAADEEYYRAMRRWHDQPWIARVFTPQPVLPELPPVLQKRVPPV